jgi:hypothetical protein
MMKQFVTDLNNLTQTPEGIAMLIAAILFAVILTWIFIKGAWKALILVSGLALGTVATYYILPSLPPNFKPNQIAIFMGGVLSTALIAKLYKPGLLVLSIVVAITAVCYLQTL